MYADKEVKHLFSPGSMVLFWGARKLSSYLVRAKVYPLERKVGSCGCGKRRCQVCLKVTETDSFTSTSTNKTYKINHLFNCIGECLVYLLTCWVCLKQDVGQTVDDFWNRWNNYKSNDRKYLNRQQCFQEHIFKHFNGYGHSGFLETVSITLIDKTDPPNREKQDNYWIQTLKTMVPWGLNVLGNIGWSNLDCYKCSVNFFFKLLAVDHPVGTSFVFGQDFWIHYIYCYICKIK